MESIDRVPVDYLRTNRVVPTFSADGRLTLEHCEAPDPQVVYELAALLGGVPALTRKPEDEVAAALDRLEIARDRYEPDRSVPVDVRSGEEDDLSVMDLEELANRAPVVRAVNLMLLEAVEADASDVHLEPRGSGLVVRHRIDGTLREATPPAARLAAAVVSRLKIMAGLDIAERRAPQDGRVKLRADGREIDVRVSTLPSLRGESLVLRILEAGGKRLPLDGLGMADDIRASLDRFARKSQGLLIATGPTGSGKTTALYALLDHLRTGGEKIIAVEDPVEYELAGVVQVPVNRKAGLTFPVALRSILRQDPDIVLVGEMRDHETAEICARAALTGHLVLSTLHTNDAPSALIRLLDLGLPDYLITSTVDLVLAQRLVRRVCPACAGVAAVPHDILRELERVGVPHSRDVPAARGCERCRGTGYRGRIGIYELLEVDAAIKAAFRAEPDHGRLRSLALDSGMRPLRSDGWRQVIAGETTIEEIVRVT